MNTFKKYMFAIMLTSTLLSSTISATLGDFVDDVVSVPGRLVDDVTYPVTGRTYYQRNSDRIDRLQREIDQLKEEQRREDEFAD